MAKKPTQISIKKAVGKLIPDFKVGGGSEYPFLGITTKISNPKELTPGAAQDELNWITGVLKDNIALRNGMAYANTNDLGTGKVSGLGVGTRKDGTQFLFWSYAQKINYLSQTGVATEVNTANILPSAASGEDVSFEFYNGLSGTFIIISSPNSDIYKIHLASPGDIMPLASGTYRGKIKIIESRIWLWNIKVLSTGNQDLTGVSLSYIDRQMFASFNSVNNEILAAGDGSTKVFSGTLATKSARPKVNVFAVQIVAPSGTTKNISGITQSANAQLTVSGHGYTAGDTIIIAGLSNSSAGAGTITASGNQSIVGSSTSFTSQLAVGGIIQYTLSNGNVVYLTIQTITDDTHLTTTQNAPSASGVTYNYLNMGDINNIPLQVVNVIDTNNFTVNINSTNFNKYVSGGTTQKCDLLQDNSQGVLSGQNGASGTINYITGAYTLNLVNAVANGQNLLATYLWEDSTNQGIADFSYNTSSRVSGSGDYFPQDGGPLLAVIPFQDAFQGLGAVYCFHLLNVWQVNTNGDTSASSPTNRKFYDYLSFPSSRAAFSNGDGITYLDYTNKQNPRVRRLNYDDIANLVPTELSDNLNLSGYNFNTAVMYDYGDYDLLWVQTIILGKANGYNNRLLIRSKQSSAWDILDCPATCATTYNSGLIAGDTLSNNPISLFTGYDDFNNTINNFWTSGQHNLGIDGRKKVNRLEVDGYINPSQSLQVWLSYDGGNFILVDTIIGNSSYVDLANGTMVGSQTIGKDVVGSSGAPNAFHFNLEFNIASDIFQYVTINFVAIKVGAVQVNYYKFKDIRFKGRKTNPTYYQK